MSIPTHGPDCVTKAFETICNDCNKPVWFFKCNCGSKIYFDSLGSPWPFHNCSARAITEALLLLKEIERMSDDEIHDFIFNYEKKYSLTISDDILNIIESVIGKRKHPFKVNPILPTADIKDISGQVMNVNKDVNLLKRFKYENNPIGIGLLGKLGKEKYSEITIREKPNQTNESAEYKILVTQNYYRKNPIKKGDFILGSVTIVKHSKGDEFVFTSYKAY